MHRKLQEMSRTRNARVVVAYRLFAAITQRILRQVDVQRRDFAQILFDTQLVLRGRRHNAGAEDRPFSVNFVAMIADAARRFGTTMTDTGA